MKTTKQIVLLAALLAAFAVGSGPATAKETSRALNLARELNQAFIEVADAASPSVVVIRVAHKPEFSAANENGNPFLEMLPPQLRKQFEQRFRDDSKAEPRRRNQKPVFDGEGSGIVIREDGYIITNGHVVEGADRILVRFKDGKEYDAEVRGVDTQSDIAVVKIKAKDLPAAKFADSDKVKVGEFAIAIGAPFELDYSVTFGHVSAKGRNRIIPDPSMDQDFIQTDASINPGNSGGPLVDVEGNIVGINTFILTKGGGSEGLGFAIPSSVVKFAYPQLRKYGHVHRGEIGINVQTVTPALAAGLGLAQDHGVIVSDIAPGGPADSAGLKIQDVIGAVDGRSVESLAQFGAIMYLRKGGEAVKFDVIRGSQRLILEIQVAERRDEVHRVADLDPEGNLIAKLGILGVAINKNISEALPGLRIASGVIVAARAAYAATVEAGLQSGDIIHALNRVDIISLDGLRQALDKLKTGDSVVLQIERQGELMYLAVDME